MNNVPLSQSYCQDPWACFSRCCNLANTVCHPAALLLPVTVVKSNLEQDESERRFPRDGGRLCVQIIYIRITECGGAPGSTGTGCRRHGCQCFSFRRGIKHNIQKGRLVASLKKCPTWAQPVSSPPSSTQYLLGV